MSEFKKGDQVRLVSTEATDRRFGYDDDEMCAVSDTFIIYLADDDDSVSDQAGNWYSMLDIEEVVVDSPVQTTEATSNINLNDIDLYDLEGEDLKVINLANMHEHSVEDLTLNEVYRVEEADDGDNTLYIDGEWYPVTMFSTIETSETTEPVYMYGELEEETEDVVKERDINYLLTRDSVTLSIDGDSEVASFDHVNFTAIRDHVLAGEYDEAMGLMNIAIGIQNWGQGSLHIDDGKIVYTGMVLTGKLIDRIVDMMAEGNEAFERFAKFLNLTMEQGSFKTRERLMDFAAHDKLDINDDGHVVAFKNVSSSYYDKHSGTFRNMVGDSPSMRRSDVDDNHDTQCSQGLHVCSPTYLKGFWGTSGKTMRVVVDPRDFVAIPYDYNDSKARVCRYKVVEDVTDKMDNYL